MEGSELRGRRLTGSALSPQASYDGRGGRRALHRHYVDQVRAHLSRQVKTFRLLIVGVTFPGSLTLTSLCSRVARTKLNRKPFYGHPLQISYSPEYETFEDVKSKLEERKALLLQRTKGRTGAKPSSRSNQNIG